MIEWLQVVKADIARLDKMTPAEKFRYWCLKLVDVLYIWGMENLFGVDCSGTVCFALWMMGYNIRLNAQGLYDEIFVKPVNDYTDNQAVMAVFYGQENMTHVTPVVGRYVVLDAAIVNEPTKLKTAKSVREWYEQRGYKTKWRMIDWARAKELSRLDRSSWDVDPALQLLRSEL